MRTKNYDELYLHALFLNEIDIHYLKMLQAEFEETGCGTIKKKLKRYENRIDRFFIKC